GRRRPPSALIGERPDPTPEPDSERQGAGAASSQPPEADARSNPMTERTSYVPGTPSWIDIGVPDTAKAAAFYGDLLGWSADFSGAEEAGRYAMVPLRGTQDDSRRP